MVEILRTRQLETALSAYRIWVNRSIKLGFYPESVALAVNESGFSILIVEGLHDAYTSTLLVS